MTKPSSSLINNSESGVSHREPNIKTATTNKKAIILLPVDSVPGYKDTSVDDIQTALEQSGYLVDIYRDDKVTVSLMKTLPDYSFVYMATHGGVGFYGIGRNVQIMTGQVADITSMSDLWTYLTGNGVTLMTPINSNKAYFALNAKFFNDLTYPNTFIYMNACSSEKNDSLADAFLAHGASVYMGWDNISFLDLGNLDNGEFFQELAKPNNTLKQSYTNTLAKYYPATVFKDDNHDGKRHIKLLNGKDLPEGDQVEWVNDTSFDYTLSLKYKGNENYVLNTPSNIAGSWYGDWQHTTLQGNIPVIDEWGNLLIVLNLTGSSISGSITVQGSPCSCFASISGSLSGSISGSAVTLSLASTGATGISITGSVSGNTISGSYSISGGSCNGESGKCQFNKVTCPSILPSGLIIVGAGSQTSFTVAGGTPPYTISSSDAENIYNSKPGDASWTVPADGGTFTVHMAEGAATNVHGAVRLSITDATGWCVTDSATLCIAFATSPCT